MHIRKSILLSQLLPNTLQRTVIVGPIAETTRPIIPGAQDQIFS